MVDSLRSDTNVIFVRADQLFQLMRGGGLGTGLGTPQVRLIRSGTGGPGSLAVPGLFALSGGLAVDARGRSIPIPFPVSASPIIPAREAVVRRQ